MVIFKFKEIFKYFIIKSEIIKLNFKIAHDIKCRLEKILIYARSGIPIFKNVKKMSPLTIRIN